MTRETVPKTTQGDFVPRAPRFKVAGAGEATVTISRTQEVDQQPFVAELIDVSQHGTKLRVPVNLRFEEALQITIEVKDSEIEYHGIASVRHIRSDDDEHWLVGCAIAPPLSDEAFSFLATTAGKERRRFRRLNIAAEATVRRQAQTEGIAVALHNLSSGGFCFSSTDQYEVGEHVKLFLDGMDGEMRVIDASICWQVDSPDGSIAGCQFASRESYAELCACLTDQPALVGPALHTEAPTSKLVLTAAVLAMFVPPMMTLMLQANKVSAESGTPMQQASLSQDVECQERVAKLTIAEETLEKSNNDKLPSEIDEFDLLASEPAVLEVIEPATEELTEIDPVDMEPTENVEAPTLREWVDNTGKFRTMAELLDVTDEYIVLLKPDGKESKVPWRRLSEADREFVETWQASQDE